MQLKNNEQFFKHDTFMESYLKKEEPDCILYSRDGIKFNIHKEILYQTELMKNILQEQNTVCCQNIEIFCPCSDKELESVLSFLYYGTISHENENNFEKIKEILTKIFAFPEKLFSFEVPVTTAIKIENESEMSEEYFEYEVEDWSDDEIVVISDKDERKKPNKKQTKG